MRDDTNNIIRRVFNCKYVFPIYQISCIVYPRAVMRRKVVGRSRILYLVYIYTTLLYIYIYIMCAVVVMCMIIYGYYLLL